MKVKEKITKPWRKIDKTLSLQLLSILSGPFHQRVNNSGGIAALVPWDKAAVGFRVLQQKLKM